MHIFDFGKVVDQLAARFDGGPWSAHAAAETGARRMLEGDDAATAVTPSAIEQGPPRASAV
jgi:hypothetical protein